MSSHKLTAHLHSFQSVSRFGTYASRNRPCRPVPFVSFLFYLNLFSEPMHVCNLAHVWTLQRLAIWSTFWLSTTFPFLLEPMQVVIAPAVQFPMDLCSASAIQPISFLFCCKSKLFNSKKMQISNPRFPLLLFTLSNTQTHKLHYRSTSSQDPLQSSQCCRSRKTPMPAYW